MNKLDTFLQKHGTKLMLVLLILIYFKSCGVDSEVERVKKDLRITEQRLVETNQEIDTLTNVMDLNFKSLPNTYDLKIEGLRVEKRMIQATNRKMLDVKRQNVIEKEIEKLEKIQASR